MADRYVRTVYRSDKGRLCPGCGWPAANCKCSTQFEEKIPERPVAKLRLEKSGRGGKIVTVVDGLPRNGPFLKDLAQELKRSCGSGGTTFETGVEIQGDKRDRIRDVLFNKGFIVKG